MEQGATFKGGTFTKMKLPGVLQKVNRRKRERQFVQYLLIPLVIIVGIFSYLTNPFVRFSIVVDPYKNVQVTNDQFVLNPDSEIFLKDRFWFRQLALVKSGWHILTGRVSGGSKAPSSTVDDIIQQINAERFDPNEPFLISGDHFSVLYPRSLGIFYHALLDPRTPLNAENWKNRQLIYLKTTAYALQVYAESDRLSTTIVPIGPRSVALINIYAPPSDTLYSLLYALKVMQDEQLLPQLYPFQSDQPLSILATKEAAAQLTQEYAESLKGHYAQYRQAVYDEQTGLIRKDILLSSTKDIAKRSSAFYDNVIFWRTTQLAMELGIIDSSEENQQFLDELKKRILSTYWLENEGYFLEDLSTKGLQDRYYSSDWLIAYQTGFLSPAKADERPYLVRSVNYIQRNALDQPFGLQYSPDLRVNQLHWPVRLFAPDYGSRAIWSNWGMQYIKLLANLAQVTHDQSYLFQANQQVSSYSFNIKRYRGYPEVYSENGDFFRQRLYKSVRTTGWVVDFEETRDMVQWTRTLFESSPSGQLQP